MTGMPGKLGTLTDSSAACATPAYATPDGVLCGIAEIADPRSTSIAGSLNGSDGVSIDGEDCGVDASIAAIFGDNFPAVIRCGVGCEPSPLSACAEIVGCH